VDDRGRVCPTGFGLLFGLLLAVGSVTSPVDAADPPADAERAQSGGEAARKAEILGGERWRRVMFEFNTWLDVQPVYTPEQVRRIRRELADRVVAMSSFELEYLLETMDGKLKVLESPAARDARRWLGQYLAVMSDSKRAAVLGELPDVLDMSAVEIEAAVKRVEAKRAEVERRRQETVSSRENFGRFQAVVGQAAAAERDRLSALGTPSFSPYRGPPVESAPFADAYDSPTVVGVGPWGTYLGIPVGAF
jgi:hypothetical protein